MPLSVKIRYMLAYSQIMRSRAGQFTNWMNQFSQFMNCPSQFGCFRCCVFSLTVWFFIFFNSPKLWIRTIYNAKTNDLNCDFETIGSRGTYTNEQPDLLCLFFLGISFLLGGWRTTLIAVSKTAFTFLIMKNTLN
jgi:hypothetical protein